MNDNTQLDDCQELIDESQIDFTEKLNEPRWRKYKIQNLALSTAYALIDKKKSDRLKECARFLKFTVDENDTRRLVSSNSCRVRLCPVCAWRRSLKCFRDTMRIVDYINEHYDNMQYVFITLTVRNCKADELDDTIDKLFYSFNKLSKRKEFKSAYKGYVRNAEVTHNVDAKSKSYDTFHPHLHILACVSKSYFNSRCDDYISKKKLKRLWADCLEITDEEYRKNLQVDIKRVKGNTSDAVAECSKYAAKSSDYVIADDFDLTVNTVRALDSALANRRLCTYALLFKDVKKILNISDVDDDDVDLTDVIDATEEQAEILREECYYFHSGYQQYYKIKD